MDIIDKESEEKKSHSIIKLLLFIIPFIMGLLVVLVPKFKKIFLNYTKLIKSYRQDTNIIISTIIIGILFQVFLHWQLIINVICGYIFGFKIGFIIGLFITMISTSISFFITRLSKKNDTIKSKENNIGRVIMSRILPHHLTSLYWGTTTISFNYFFIGTLIAMLPLTIFETYGGSLLNNISEVSAKIFKSNHNMKILLLLFICICIVVIYKLSIYYKKQNQLK